MKKSILSVFVLSCLYAQASDFVIIVDKKHNEYKTEPPYTENITYSNWKHESYNNCIEDNKSGNLTSDYYYDIEFNQEQTCDERQSRIATITKTYEDGSETVRHETEYQTLSNISTINKALGTHLESNCKNILSFDPTLSDGYYQINHNGGMNVECDMTTDGGGWTLIYTANKNYTNVAAVENIDDQNHLYTDVLYKSNSNVGDLATESSKRYRWNGYHPGLNTIKISGTWYHADLGYVPTPLPDKIPTSNFTYLSKEAYCYTETNVLETNCGDHLKIKVNGRIQGISDVQSVANVALTNNYFSNKFKIYVK